MSLRSFFRISDPSSETVPEERVHEEYLKRRNRTFWGVTGAYALYYVCRLTLTVVKQPLIDGGVLTAQNLGIVGSTFYFAYAAGKFLNGFIADYCNIRRFMAVGLVLSTIINLVMGLMGLMHGWLGFSTTILFILFAIVWGLNGYSQSMGAPPAVISLSRWFPLAQRGTYYSIVNSTPYLGKAVSIFLLGLIVGKIGWEYGFLFSAVAGVLGSALILVLVSDTPQSVGLPSVRELSGEPELKSDSRPTSELQKNVIRHPGIWIIAISSAFIYITQHAVSDWGVLFLQKSGGFSLGQATQIISFSEAFGIVGSVFAGWVSDRVFKGNRFIPVFILGVLCLAALTGFLFLGGGYVMNLVYVSVFSVSIGAVYCIVAGLMALDIVPRKATGAALGIVGLWSYACAGIQNLVSGFMIEDRAFKVAGGETFYDFGPVSIFWTVACVLSFLIPVVSWRLLRPESEINK